VSGLYHASGSSPSNALGDADRSRFQVLASQFVFSFGSRCSVPWFQVVFLEFVIFDAPKP